jgi:hypothetical protein
MPANALSLVGFISDREAALRYLRHRCLPQPLDRDDAALEADWRAAQAALGAPVARAGHPTMRPIAFSDPHIAALLGVDWAPRIKPLLTEGATFQMVEIAPLIAAQITVDCDRATAQCAGLSRPPADDELMGLSFPLQIASGTVNVSRAGQSMIIKSDSLNLVITAQGSMPIARSIVGVNVGWTLPIVDVVRLRGRCILHNGYNRVFGASQAGATEIPCLVRDVPDATAAGLFDPAASVSEATLMSDNPPTLAHFTEGHALEIQLRRSTRLIQVSWSQHTLYDE